MRDPDLNRYYRYFQTFISKIIFSLHEESNIQLVWEIQCSACMRNPIEVQRRLGEGWAESPLWWLASWNIEWKFNLLLTFCNLLGDTSLGERRGILRGRKVYTHSTQCSQTWTQNTQDDTNTNTQTEDTTRQKDYSMHVSPNVINETTKKQCVHTV